MKWEMEMEEVEAVLEKIWDLHDKLSDAIHTISRTHFSKSLNNNNNKGANFNTTTKTNNKSFNLSDGNVHQNQHGFVFMKEYDKDAAISEARSLNSIRSALEHLEDHLEFFHTVQIQQRAERDAALARLEQSRIILALRLAEHHGKKYKVIDEAMDFVGDVRDANCFVGAENLSNAHKSAPADHAMQRRGLNSNILVRVLFSSLDSAKRTLQLDKMGGVLGNAALFALSMLAWLQLHQVTHKENNVPEIGLKQDRFGKKPPRLDGFSSISQFTHLDVRLARG